MRRHSRNQSSSQVANAHAPETEVIVCVKKLVTAGMVRQLRQSDSQRKYVFTGLCACSLRRVHKCVSSGPRQSWPTSRRRRGLGASVGSCSSSCNQIIGGNFSRLHPQRVQKEPPSCDYIGAILRMGVCSGIFKYLRGIHIEKHKPYMLALLQWKKLLQDCRLLELHHCQPVKYHERVLASPANNDLQELLNLLDAMSAVEEAAHTSESDGRDLKLNSSSQSEELVIRRRAGSSALCVPEPEDQTAGSPASSSPRL